jgi:hypothetical protein
MRGNHQVSDTSHVELDALEDVTAVTMKYRRETDVSEEHIAPMSKTEKSAEFILLFDLRNVALSPK